MDSSQGSSFIPKAPVRGAVSKRRVRKVYVFTYLIYIVFICSLLAAAGFWFIHFTAQNKLATAQKNLTEERNKFNDSDVVTVMQLNERMVEAEALLSGQVSVVRALEAVEAVTVSSVSMTGLKYEKNESANLSFSLVAKTEDFNSARYQREVLAANAILAGSKLTNVQYGISESAADGAPVTAAVVSFNISKTLEPGAIAPASVPQQDEVPAATDAGSPSEGEDIDGIPEASADEVTPAIDVSDEESL